MLGFLFKERMARRGGRPDTRKDILRQRCGESNWLVGQELLELSFNFLHEVGEAIGFEDVTVESVFTE
jgi:hypothetical protein